MEATNHDEADVIRAAGESGARVQLIGRQAIVALGGPVVTHDIDFWLHIDDIERLTDAFEDIGFTANKTPAEARRAGRYVLENALHVDVLVARSRISDAGSHIAMPNIEDLIATKRWASRAKDIADIQFLESLRAKGVS